MIQVNPKYAKLITPVTLPNGTVLRDRYALSPIVTNSSTSEGHISEEDVNYAARRANSAGIQITGAAYIEEYGQLFEYGFSSSHDSDISGLAQLAEAMKKDGNKAILQLTHAGRFSSISLKDFGTVYGPSEMYLKSPIEHTVHEMSKRKIQHVIRQYGEATSRAIKAGWDGVEISGAQRLLIQTFFSTYSNKRIDEYGTQNMENRSRFGVEVLKEVQRVIEEDAPDGFILGYRGTAEEARGTEYGNLIEEFNEYLDRLLVVADIQYVALASWGRNIYQQTVRNGQHKGEVINKVVHDHLNGRVPMMATGGISTPDKALDALEYADMVGMSGPFITEPDFVLKIAQGREEEISLTFTENELVNLAIPQAAFKDIVGMIDLGKVIPEESRDKFRELEKNYDKK